jgi:hypothetical protein
MIVKMILLVFCLVLASCDETRKGKANGYPSGLMVYPEGKDAQFYKQQGTDQRIAFYP